MHPRLGATVSNFGEGSNLLGPGPVSALGTCTSGVLGNKRAARPRKPAARRFATRSCARRLRILQEDARLSSSLDLEMHVFRHVCGISRGPQATPSPRPTFKEIESSRQHALAERDACVSRARAARGRPSPCAMRCPMHAPPGRTSSTLAVLARNRRLPAPPAPRRFAPLRAVRAGEHASLTTCNFPQAPHPTVQLQAAPSHGSRRRVPWNGRRAEARLLRWGSTPGSSAALT